jgi:hypothetical protein
MTAGSNQLLRAIFTKKGKVTERFRHRCEDRHLYEFSLEDFTMPAQV